MIIAFTGKKQSGKSTACAYLEKVTQIARRINFKDPLVQEIKDRFPTLLNVIIKTLDETQYDGINPWTVERLFNEKPPLIRALLQNYGTDVRRVDDPNYWVVTWKKNIHSDDLVICDDVRFLNEAEAVHSLGGVIVRIVREDLPHTDTHISESEMDQIRADYTISIKTGEYETLYRFLDKVLCDVMN